MLHIRLIVPDELLEDVLDVLQKAPEITNLWHLPNAAIRPPGALVSCDVAKEEGSTVIAELKQLELDKKGSIAVESVDASISAVAEEAERAAPGMPVDAIVWEEVEDRVSESASLSVSFLVFIMVATMIAAIGIITDSIPLIIGAMVVGPEYGPLAGVCVALIEGRRHLVVRSLTALAVGFPIAIAAAGMLTWVLRVTGVAPNELGTPDERELTLFISQPNWYALIVALVAGVVGMLALVSAKSGALVGVLISVTTIPAAGNVGVAIVYGATSEALGAAGQLGLNLTSIVVSGLVVLKIAQRNQARRRARRPLRHLAPRPKLGSDMASNAVNRSSQGERSSDKT
jgi:uncharacterized hydrophobic protein (TIGR00271 family)